MMVKKSSFTVLAIVLSIVFSWLSCFGEFRMWTGNNGISLEAELVGVSEDGTKVFFKTRQGVMKQSDVANLVYKDACYLEEQRKQTHVEVLTQFRGQWLSQEQIREVIENERDRKCVAEAMKLIKTKSKAGATFKVIQVLNDGIVCYLKAGSFLIDRGSDLCAVRGNYNEEFFVLLGADNRYAADNEWFTGDLYWSGNFTYVTVKNVPTTVNSYCISKELATLRVRKVFNLFDKNAEPSGASNGETRKVDSGESELKGFGSGFLVSKDGYLLTNCHVVRNAKQIKVRTANGVFPARLVAQDPDNDIALLKVDGEYPNVLFASEKKARLGQTVFTVGFPMPELQGFSPKVTKGVISSLNGLQDDIRMYQIDAAVQPGNSGGPLADENGNVIGVVVARLNDAYVAQNTGSLPQNINYAVKKSYVLAFLDNTADAAKELGVSAEVKMVPFEDAVERVQKATVMVIVY